MKFPSPPPLRTPPRPAATPALFNPNGVRTVYIVSIVFWMAVTGLVGALIVWVLLRDVLATTGEPVTVGILLNICFSLLGYFIGTWTSRMILINIVRHSLLTKKSV